MDQTKEVNLVKLVKAYFHFLDLPPNWGFGKEKKKSELALRRFVRDYHPTKQIVVRRKK